MKLSDRVTPELLRIKGLHNQLLLVRKKGVKESASAFDRYVPNY